MSTSGNERIIKENAATSYGINIEGIDSDIRDLRRLVDIGASPDAGAIIQRPLSGIANESLIPNLIEIAYSAVIEDNELSSRFVEKNMDEAVALYAAAASIRREYGELSKLFLDSYTKLYEFLHIDEIHQRETAAGLYTLPFEEASSELKAASDAIAASTRQTNLWNTLLSAAPTTPDSWDGALNLARLTNYADKQSLVAAWSHQTAKNQPTDAAVIASIQTETRNIAGWRGQVERASSWLNAEGAVIVQAQLANKKEFLERKKEYLRNDIYFRTSRAAVSRQMAIVQLNELSRAGSPLHYAQRLETCRGQFNKTVEKFYQRIKVTSIGLASIYGVRVAFRPKNDLTAFDDGAIWLLEARDLLQKFNSSQRLSVSTISVATMLKRQGRDLAQIIGAGGNVFAMDIIEADLRSPKGLLRGVSAEYIGSMSRPTWINLYMPDGASSSSKYAKDPLVFGRVMPVSSNSSIGPMHSDALWNGRSIGRWDIEIDKTVSAKELEDILIYFWHQH